MVGRAISLKPLQIELITNHKFRSIGHTGNWSNQRRKKYLLPHIGKQLIKQASSCCYFGCGCWSKWICNGGHFELDRPGYSTVSIFLCAQYKQGCNVQTFPAIHCSRVFYGDKTPETNSVKYREAVQYLIHHYMTSFSGCFGRFL